jgi:hypothetical protein
MGTRRRDEAEKQENQPQMNADKHRCNERIGSAASSQFDCFARDYCDSLQKSLFGCGAT